jgi:hypothetical protein
MTSTLQTKPPRANLTTSLSRWQTAPRSSMVVFLLAVFVVFASIGFVNDVGDMGRQRPLRLLLYALTSGGFSVCYALSGIVLRGKFWKAFIPLFTVHFLLMGLLANRFPQPPRPVQLNAIETAHLADRLSYDGLAIILAICLGYAGFAFVSIREGRRHGLALMEKAMLESEMTAAREVQHVMVPDDLPPVAGYTLHSVYRPAAEVGGDFFQVIPLNSGSTLVVLGDVSGKGLRAAMIVSMIVGSLRTVCGYTEEPAEVLAELNRRLLGRVHGGFATCLALRLDNEGHLALANAGHLPPYLDGAELATPGTLPLGLDDSAAYQQTSLLMQPGQTVLLLTDGIAEAQNEQRQLFGFARVESLLHNGATARQLADAAQAHGQTDDITILSVQRQA